MRLAFPSVIAIVLPLYILSAGLAHAGPYSDDLAKCLVKSTTTKDKSNLVRWMFAAISLHPDVESMVSINDAERNQLTRSAGNLFTKLLTESCRKETQDAFKFEGKDTISSSFRVLGSVAARGLMSHPHVSSYISELGNHFDKKKFENTFKEN